MLSKQIKLDSGSRRQPEDRERPNAPRPPFALVAAIALAVATGAISCASEDGAAPPAHRQGGLSPGLSDRTPMPASQPGENVADVHGWIAYGDASGIWALDAANPEDRVELNRRGGHPWAWSSDGSKLLIQRDAQLVVLNSDGTETVLADSDEGFISGGSFTPDGSTVVYATLGGDWTSAIYAVSSEGGSPRILLLGGRRVYYPEAGRSFRTAVSNPSLSPDGSQIAYFEGMGDWGNSLWVMNADGTGRRQILVGEEETQYGHVYTLQWSPDGTRLSFAFRGEPGGINIVNADGSDLSRLGRGRNPYWSPDGSWISYSSLWIATPGGSHVRDLGDGRSGPWIDQLIGWGEK